MRGEIVRGERGEAGNSEGKGVRGRWRGERGVRERMVWRERSTGEKGEVGGERGEGRRW